MKNHDFCPEIIEGYQTKYNLTNPSFYTRLHCSCDQAFYECLKTVNSRTSNQIGTIYFTALGTKCYKEEYPVTGCSKYTYFPKSPNNGNGLISQTTSCILTTLHHSDL
ncbi:unnamed protein product [Callosobruchus maculatus]|uniref:phospholipase A2 n=1 Tax=Callosobruchus maculatus TaxID=64391 RepID=A0A653BQ84_CALMS|nr:unnamed protein product [Callosobruchus maculatus]